MHTPIQNGTVDTVKKIVENLNAANDVPSEDVVGEWMWKTGKRGKEEDRGLFNMLPCDLNSESPLSVDLNLLLSKWNPL